MKAMQFLKKNSRELLFGITAFLLFITLFFYVVISIQFVLQQIEAVLNKNLTNTEVMTIFDFTGLDAILEKKNLGTATLPIGAESPSEASEN